MSKRNQVNKPSGKPAPSKRPVSTPATSSKQAVSSYGWIGLIAAALGGLLYANTIGHQYCLDDYSIIVDNWVVKGGLKNIGTIFSTEYRFGAWNSPGSLYRPLTLTMMAIEYGLAPDKPWLGHFLNVVFYALTGGMLWLTLRRMLADYTPLLPALATLLFMAHPVHTEVVANIKSRDEIVALLLSIAALYAIFKYFDHKKVLWLISAVLMYGLSLFTKESVITFLAIFPLSIWFFTNKSIGENLKVSALFLAPAAFYLITRHRVLEAQVYPEVYSILDNFMVGAKNSSEKLASAFMMCGRYLWTLIFPHPLVSDMGYPQMKPVGFGDWRAILGFLSYLGMGIWAVLNLSKKHFLSYAILLYMAAFSLFSNVFITIGTSYGERLLYGPSLGFALALAWILLRVFRADFKSQDLSGGGKATPAIMAGALLLLFYSVKTISRNPDWYDSYSLYQSDIVKSPDCAKLNYHIALEEAKLGQDEDAGTVTNRAMVEKAIGHYSKAIELYPKYHDAFGSRGLAYFRLQEYDKAFTDYQTALKYRPNDARVLSNMGYIYFMRQEMPKAEEIYRKAIAADPRFIDARRNLGAVLAMRKDFNAAIEQWKEGLKYEPENPTLNFYIGSAYTDSGRPDLAQPWLEKAYRLDPSLKK
jgi:tetratricopeptide (TPR) repeat protein